MHVLCNSTLTHYISLSSKSIFPMCASWEVSHSLLIVNLWPTIYSTLYPSHVDYKKYFYPLNKPVLKKKIKERKIRIRCFFWYESASRRQSLSLVLNGQQFWGQVTGVNPKNLTFTNWKVRHNSVSSQKSWGHSSAADPAQHLIPNANEILNMKLQFFNLVWQKHSHHKVHLLGVSVAISNILLPSSADEDCSVVMEVYLLLCDLTVDLYFCLKGLRHTYNMQWLLRKLSCSSHITSKKCIHLGFSGDGDTTCGTQDL